MKETKKARVLRKPTFGEALVPIILSVIVLLVCIVGLGTDPHVPLFLACVICAVFAFYLGSDWKTIEEGIFRGIQSALLPMVIILLIGMTVGGWIAAGTVPYIIYWGLKLINPTWFLLTTCLMCCIMSMCLGSSWTTAGTLGVALMGVGYGLGIPPAMTAGAVVSGSFFGDKQSPLSDSTNFAPAVAGTTLFEHINSMIYSTGPAIVISLIIYGVLGLRFRGGQVDTENINLILNTLESNFNLNIGLLIPLIVLIVLIVKKVPAIASMSIAALLGLIFAITFQGSSFGQAIKYLHYGYVGTTGIGVVDKLLSRGGLHSMLWTISLMFVSLAMAGILEKTGALEAILDKLRSLTKSVFGLITTTLFSVLTLNFFAADPYLAMLLPAKTFGKSFDEKGIDRKVLSRTLEDTGTLGCPMVPWGTSGVFMATTLGVATLSYLPYYFLGLVTPIVSMILAATGIGIFYTDKNKKKGKAVNE